MKRCPLCGETSAGAGIVLAIGVLLGALLVVVPLALAWPRLVA